MNKDPSKINITKFGLCFYLAMVLTLFYGYAQSTLAPQSILGEFTTTTFGFIVWSLVIIGVAGLLEYGFKKYGIKTLYYSA
ncbi:hypothetical protein SOPP22_14235 [Shewanella sp. OPT22]|nr:hypothetical protein SOPP22_14235 [Shewanella sp. OPT22]